MWRFDPYPDPYSAQLMMSASWSLDQRLPALRTSFRGREDDLAALEALVEQTRLITLTGPGGCGKTRLAVEFGRRVMDRFDGGVILVDFAPVTEPDLVPQTLARSLRIQESGQGSSVSLLAERIAGRPCCSSSTTVSICQRRLQRSSTRLLYDAPI